MGMNRTDEKCRDKTGRSGNLSSVPDVSVISPDKSWAGWASESEVGTALIPIPSSPSYAEQRLLSAKRGL